MATRPNTTQHHDLMSSFPTSKRSACDRCRRQKSRCTRSGIEAPCENCIKAGHICTTGFTRPLGKPTHCSINGSDGSEASSLHSPSALITPGIHVPLASISGSRATSTGSDEVSVSGHYEVAFDHLDSDVQSFWPSPNTMETLFQDDYQNHLQGTLTPSLSTAIPATSIPTPHYDQNHYDQYSTNMDLGTCRMKSNPELPGASSVNSCYLQLSDLQVRLSQQLQTSSHKARDLSQTRIHPASIDSESKSFGSVLEIALEMSSIFESIIQDDEASDASEHTANYAGRHMFPGNDTLRILTFLLTYCQLAAIFDNLLQHVIKSLQHRKRVDSVHLTMSGRVRKEPCLTGFCIDGFAVRQDTLQTKLLIQTIQHHFQIIERLLGLPIAFRISDCQHTYPAGLLGDTSSSPFLQAMMTDEHAGALGPVGILRDSIAVIKRLIE